MNKRHNPVVSSTGGAKPPPLPAGQPPSAADAAQQASISAAWASYYQQLGVTPQPSASAAAPPANAAQYSNYGYGAGAAPAIQSAYQGAPAIPAASPYMGGAPAANVGPQAYPAPVYGQPQAQMPMAAAGQPMAQQPYMHQAYQQHQQHQPAPQQQTNMMMQQQQHQQHQQPAQRPPFGRPPQQQFGNQGMMQGSGMNMGQPQMQGGGMNQMGAQLPMNNQAGGWQQQGNMPPGNQPYSGPHAGPVQPRPPPPQFNQPRPPPPRNNPMTPSNQPPYNAPAPYSPQQAPMAGAGSMRPPMRPNAAGPPQSVPGQGFPPTKRPRVDGPPQQGNFGPQGARSVSVSSQRGGMMPGGPRQGNRAAPMHQQPSGYGGGHYPAPPPSEYGGSHDGSVRSSVPGRGGLPMSRGRGGGPVRGAMAGRGGRGGAVMGHADATRTPLGPSGRGGLAPRGGANIRGGRGGAPFASGPGGPKPYSPAVNGTTRLAGAPKGPRDPRAAGRGGVPAKPAPRTSTSTKPPASSRDREKERIREEEREKAAKEEARRRTFTDFRIVGLEIKSLGWRWGEIGEDVEEVKEASEEEDVGSDDDDVDDADDSDGEETSHRREKEGEASVEVTAASSTVQEQRGDVVKSEAVNNDSAEVKKVATQLSSDLPADLQDIVRQEAAGTDGREATKGAVSKLSSTESAPAAGQSSDATETLPPSEATSDAIKRGEKRKAKMSSPDVDDDARLTSKKRPHLTDGKESPNVKSSLSDKNRFRIYFDSPVAPPEPAAPRAMKRKADVSDDTPRVAPGPNAIAEAESGDGVQATDVSDVADDTASQVADVEQEQEDQGDVDQQPITEEAELFEDAQEVAGEEDAVDSDAQLQTADSVEGTYEQAVDQFYDQIQPGESGVDSEQLLNGDEHNDVEESSKQIIVSEADAPQESADELHHADDGVPAQGDVSMADAEPSEGVEPTGAEQTEGTEANGGPAPEPLDGSVALISTTAAPSADSAQAPAQSSDKDAGDEKRENEAAAVEAARIAKALKESAKNTTAAYGTRAAKIPLSDASAKTPAFRRSPSLPPTDPETPLPAPGRLSILYDNGTRRMCLDAAVVEKVRIYRKKGVIQVTMRLSTPRVTENNIEQISRQTEEMGVGETAKRNAKGKVKAESAEKPELATSPAQPEAGSVVSWNFTRGLLLEILDESRGLFSQVTREALVELWKDAEHVVANAPPPVHRLGQTDEANEVVNLTAYLDRRRPLSEPKWVKTGQLDEWVQSITGNSNAAAARKNHPDLSTWDGKLEVVDPDAPPTINSVLENWASRSKVGHLKARRRFINTHFSSMGNIVQILLRVLRGDAKNTVSRHQLSHLHGPLATATKPSAPYADQQTHATLAVLAIVNLTKDYAIKSGEKVHQVDGKISDIIKSLPNHLIFASVDRLFADWQAKAKKRVH